MEESDSRVIPGMGARDNPTEQPKLQLFYSEQGSDSRHVAGFGWMNDSQFIYGQYEFDEINRFDKLILK